MGDGGSIDNMFWVCTNYKEGLYDIVKYQLYVDDQLTGISLNILLSPVNWFSVRSSNWFEFLVGMNC